MTLFSQRPAEKRNYRQILTGDTISSAAWTLTPGGTLGTPVNESTQSTVSVSALLDGRDYTFTCHIVAASLQEFEGVAKIEVRS